MGSSNLAVRSAVRLSDSDQHLQQDDSSARKQPLGCPQEEDEADKGGDGEVQGGVRGHGQKTSS